MANKDSAAVLVKLKQAPYAARFREVFGQNIFADPAKAFAQAMYAIERFELEDPSFHPYTSKFDYYLDGKLQLTAQELRGKKLFDNPAGGNCASCHIDQAGVDGSHPLFTDFNFQALGVPRNPELRAMPIRSTSTWVYAARYALINRATRVTAGSSNRCRRAIRRRARCSSTTAVSTR